MISNNITNQKSSIPLSYRQVFYHILSSSNKLTIFYCRYLQINYFYFYKSQCNLINNQKNHCLCLPRGPIDKPPNKYRLSPVPKAKNPSPFSAKIVLEP